MMSILLMFLLNIYGIKCIGNAPNQIGENGNRNVIVLETVITDISGDSLIVVPGIAFQLSGQCSVTDVNGSPVFISSLKFMLPAEMELVLERIDKNVIVKAIKVKKTNLNTNKSMFFER